MDEWGECLGYISEPCEKCGRLRVEKYENGKHVCEKCGWCPEDQEYIDYDNMYQEEDDG